MNVLRKINLLALGMALTYSLLVGAVAVQANGMADGWGAMDGDGMDILGGGHMGGGDYGVMPGGHMNVGYLGELHEAGEMMDDPGMMAHMMEMMHGGEHMSLAECEEWMSDHEMPGETRAECLSHMAEHHRVVEMP